MIDLSYNHLYIRNNPLLPVIEWNQLTDIKAFAATDFDITSNASLERLELNALEDVESNFSIQSNNVLETIELQQLINVHRQVRVLRNSLLTSLSAPQLFSVGDYLFGGTSFEISDNTLLSNLDLSSFRKAYGYLTVVNNNSLDTSTAFPCDLYVFYNDGFDCNPGGVGVARNLDNNYCFQDLLLRVDSDLTTTPIYAITSVIF